MLKTFEIYLILLFLKRLLIISGVFLSLVVVLSVFDEISFFKESNVSFLLPFFITFLNAPSTLFEIFPFIFLLSSQFFFLDFINRNELEALKINSINNLKLIKILLITSLALGIILITFYYNIAAKLKFVYLDLKNSHSSDNKYLAVVTDNGLWIKDEIDNKIYIINAEIISGNQIKNVSITEFSKDFNLTQVISSDIVDITNKKWVIKSPSISIKNKTTKLDNEITILTHFDEKKISGLFRNLASLSVFELIKLNRDYEALGYSTVEVKSYLNKIFSFPVYISLMTLFASIIMFNIKRNKSTIFHIILGIFLSVLIYYFYFLFNLLGENGKIPLYASIWLPLLILTIFILIGLVRIDEK